MVFSPNPLLRRRSGVVANWPPRQVGDLFLDVPDFVGDLAAGGRVCLVLGGFERLAGVFGLVGEGAGAASFQVRGFRVGGTPVSRLRAVVSFRHPALPTPPT